MIIGYISAGSQVHPLALGSAVVTHALFQEKIRAFFVLGGRGEIPSGRGSSYILFILCKNRLCGNMHREKNETPTLLK